MFGSAMLVTAFPLWVADMTEDIAERLILLNTQNRPDRKIPSTPGSSIEKIRDEHSSSVMAEKR